MSREIIFEALNGIRDEYITEAGAKLGLLAATTAAVGAVGAATSEAVDSTALYSLSSTGTAAKAGFGAWLAKGGWVALAAGVLVTAGVAVGAFFLGKSGDTPPAGSGEVTTEEQEQSRFEEDMSEESTIAESESESDPETKPETEPETESETESETETETETEVETESEAESETDTEPVTKPHEHEYGEWAVFEPATCYHTGTLYATCNGCGRKTTQYDAIEKLPHSFEDGYCAVCGLIEGADDCFTFRFFNDSNAQTVAYIHSRDGVTGERVILPNVAYDEFTKQIVPVVGLDENLFAYDETLREIILPDSLDGISKKAFAYCVNLQNVHLPPHIEVIGNMAFYGCTSLTEITIPDSVTSIYDNAFAGCTGISEIILPDSLLYLGDDIFADCTGLTRVTLPVVDLHSGLFSGCSSLTRVDFKGSVSQWTEQTSWLDSPLSPTSFTVYCNDGEVVESQE